VLLLLHLLLRQGIAYGLVWAQEAFSHSVLVPAWPQAEPTIIHNIVSTLM
jgi:hypothetical protein